MPEPSELQEMADRQDQLGQEIQAVLVRLKKDPYARKTQRPYLEKASKELDEAWSAFLANDEVLKEALPADHPYVQKDFFASIASIYARAEELIELYNEAKLPASTSQPCNKSEASANANDASSALNKDGLRRALRRQTALMEEVQQFVADLRVGAGETQSNSYYALNVRMLEEYVAKLSQGNDQILDHADSSSVNGYDVALYRALKKELLQHVMQMQQQLDVVNSRNPETLASSGGAIKLPRITLPIFTGDYLKWTQFRDLYTRLIHSQTMSSSEKMFYLVSNLSGEALKLIQHLPISDANYADAWKIMNDRYNNRRILVNSLLSRLLSQPNCPSDSAASIKAFHDTSSECLLGLKNLGVLTEACDPILLFLLRQKLDRTSLVLYEQRDESPRELDSMRNFLAFLELRFRSLESIDAKPASTKPSRSAALTTTKNQPCAVCSQQHPVYRCTTLIGQSHRERLNTVKKHKLCTNCLRTGHFARQCSSGTCRRCNQQHHTLLHAEEPKPTKPVSIVSKVPASSIQPATSLPTSTSLDPRNSSDNYILLGTVRLKVRADNGSEAECRAVLDSGSQVNFITKRLATRLRLVPTEQALDIEGIGYGKQSTQMKGLIRISSRTTNYEAQLEAFLLPKIINHQPSRRLDVSLWPVPNNVKLADPNFNEPGPIDLLIGAEHFLQLMSIGQIQLGEGLPTLQNTVFGWVVCGQVTDTPTAEPAISGVCGVCAEEVDQIENRMKEFWRLDDVTPTIPLTAQEKKCEEFFSRTTKRDSDGHFVVRLPFSQDPASLGESKDMALQRFLSLERKLAKNDSLRRQYTEFMHEYLKLGHMRAIGDPDPQRPYYFLPHHCVLRPDSTTTKLRVVFDASAKTSTNLSLNSVLHTGPALQQDVFSVLLRFRLPKFVFTADVEKMYRQVKVDERDQPYQQIIWRDSPDKPLQYFRLTTVTYGMTSAPYLAIKCLNSLATEAQVSCPLGSAAIKQNIYVDDIMTGADSLRDAEVLKQQVIKLLGSGGFHLRKWCSNALSILREVPFQERALQLEIEDRDCHVKTLGLTWLPATDDFCISLSEITNQKVTKRTVSSDIAHLFDPLGFLSPVTIQAKILLQSLWRLKLDWDAATPMETNTRWLQFREELKLLRTLKFPRHVFSGRLPNDIQMHVFCDASEKAYGAAVYVRSQQSADAIIVRLLCAKAKVAPTAATTLARLELQAATLAAKLANRVRSDLSWQTVPCFFWCDSEIVLAWLRATSSSWCTFVANRVATIQELTANSQWRYVPSKQNVADIISRGLSPAQLLKATTWFYGPVFLHGRQDAWPPQPAKFETDAERRPQRAVLIVSEQSDDIIASIDHRNSFNHLQRIVAYLLRFANATRKLHHPASSHLTVAELDDALIVILKYCQAQSFPDDIQELQRCRQVGNRSHLASLCPFLDEKGVVRVGGRLKEAPISYEAKHPALLPYDHYITKLLMTQLHLQHAHVAPLALLTITRQRFWPIKGKTIARTIVLNCVECRRAKPQLSSQIMGNLPADRLQPSRPFLTSGVDFCGPFWTHFRVRGRKPQKTYIALFVCFSTKAVHLEVVTDLTTDAFIGALKRFVSRRGNCRDIYCDNATNFVGAYNQLRELSEILYSNKSTESIIRFCTTRGIDFHFIPPRSPHFGGLWEAAIKSAKQLLPTALHDIPITGEELATAATEVEAILNSRPLTPLSSDPNDLTALTPGHFLVGEPLTSIPNPTETAAGASLHQHWKRLVTIKTNFWQRWTREYLSQLQHRVKWKHASPNLEVGTMVVLKENNTPVLQWPLGRIVKVIQGSDGIVRVADVKTSSGILRRAITNIAPLPIEPTKEEDKSPTDEETPHEDLRRARIATDTDLEQAGPSGRKRPRRRIAASMVNVLLALMVTVATTKASSLVIWTPLDNHHGIYFEKIGESHLSYNEWSLIIYYNLSTYWAEPSVITHGFDQLEHLCNTIKSPRICATTLYQLKETFKNIQERNKLLHEQQTQRRRRGAIDLIGNIAHSLFGVLDSSYAKEMAETIQGIKGNEHRLITLLRNQTSIIDATAEIMQKTHTIISQQIQDLSANMNKTQEAIAVLTFNEQQTKTMDVFNTLATQVLLMLSGYETTQTSLLEVVIDSHHGRLNPKLLTPNQLLQQLTIIKDNLPATLKLPADYHDLHKFYNFFTIEGRVLLNQVIFRLRLPLLSSEHYEILKMHAVPISTDHGFIQLIPSSTYLMVNLARDLFPFSYNQ